MRSKVMRFGALLLGLFTVGLLHAQEGQHRATAFAEARITVENRADADGFIRLRVTPAGGQAVETTVDVLRRMSENDIAADIEKALTLVIGDKYRVDRGGGENVSIRKLDRDTTPDFTLEIAFNTPGLSITIHN